jgi:thiamine-monophosphate kinase
MLLSEVGEFGLIERIRKICPGYGNRIILGIGDDAAIVESQSGRSLILTTDALVEGVHFDLRYVPLDSLGWKALAVNLSDVAAMGGAPICCLITVAIPECWNVERFELLYQGIIQCGERYQCPIAGGDTVKSPSSSFISVSVLGEAQAGEIKKRSGARSGDLLCVTGELGGARVGLEVLRAGEDESDFYTKSISRFLKPIPRIAESQKLISELSVTSMIDISDGLASEIRHLCKASGLGCRLFGDRIPVSDETVRWAQKNGISPLEIALESGEEYELLFTVDPIILNRKTHEYSSKQTGLFSIIGEMRPQSEGLQIRDGSRARTMANKGWDHYLSGMSIG